MSGAGIQVDQDQFSCAVCLHLLKDPVTTPCGHSYCKVCINRFWDEEDQKKFYSCPQCRETFVPRPVLGKNNMLAEVVEKLKKTELQAASAAHSYAGPGDVECDSSTGRKRKAANSFLDCQASYCEDHLQLHAQPHAFKQHKLMEAHEKLQEKICPEHQKSNESHCCTEQSCKVSSCTVEKHQSPDPDATKASFSSLCVSPGHDVSPGFAVQQHLSIDETKKSLSDLTERDEEICEEELKQICPQAAAVQISLLSEPKNRQDFLQYFCSLTLDPNTAHRNLILSEMNKAATRSNTEQQYFGHPERFDSRPQVLCKESVSGRCYWEVDWSGCVSISVSYKEISRRGGGDKCGFGYNSQSWSLVCSTSSVSFWHNNIKTELQGPASSRIGVYVDHSAGTLSFYSVSDTMTLLHRVHTTFTQPLFAGFRVWYNSTMKLFDPNVSHSV